MQKLKQKPPLRSFFSPKSVTVVGASTQRGKFGNQVLINLKNIGYKGKVYPINVNAREPIHGFQTYKSLQELPEVPELAVIVLPPSAALKMVYECYDFGIKNIMLESSFISEQIEQELRVKSCQMGFRIMGSNSIGLINFTDNFSTSIIPVRCKYVEKNNKVGYVAQSGGLAGACGWWSPHANVGFSKVIHLGKSCDVNEAEVIEYLTEDPDTEVITLYLYRITDRIIKTVAECSKKIPILFLKSINSAKLHALEEAGALPVFTYQDLFEISKAFVLAPKFTGKRIGLIGPSSGALSLITCNLRNYGFELAKELEEKTKKRLREEVLHPESKIYNPVDYWPPTRFDGDEVGRKHRIAAEALLADKNIDALIIVLELFKEIEFDVVKEFSHLQEKFPDKPIIAACVQVEPSVLRRVLNGLAEIDMLHYNYEIEKSVMALDYLKRYYLQALEP
ncbi:MAG: CoA-binding protein [Candidatus Helarchaeales archaeon]